MRLKRINFKGVMLSFLALFFVASATLVGVGALGGNILSTTTKQDNVYDFSFSGKMETFTAEKEGIYRFETWGAQGGNSANFSGGKGGYSAGEVYLNKGEEIYVSVGGFGNNQSKGWNGAGKSYILDTYGGGASDIRIGGTSFFNRILVAGGGGAAGNHQSGGYAGGLASQDTGWGIATQTAGFNFGLGKSSGAGCGSAALGGAGSGWYGGYIRDQSCSGTGNSASGGSGYVLTGAKTVDGITTPASARPAGYNPDQKYELSGTVLQAGNESFYGVSGVREIGHEGDGHARITFYGKNSESSPNLSAIRINGTIIKGFDPNQDTYTINVAGEYMMDDEITVDKQHSDQVITGVGKHEIHYGNKKIDVTVLSADKTARKTYTLNYQRAESTKLYDLKIKNHAFGDTGNDTFKWNTYNYRVNSFQSEGVDIEYTAFNADAVVKIEGDKNLVKGSNEITLTVQNGSLESTVYRIDLQRKYALDYAFTGSQQFFKVPYDGIYKFETWGAQGGHSTNYRGGKGGYSSGEVFLSKGEELYINVGGFGDNQSKGWNGAGKSYILDTYGGGASDIRIGGTGFFNRILVAGGGGAAGNHQNGGYAGGLASEETGSGIATQTAGFNFGLGRSSGPGCGSAALGGAGSGWYGGYIRDQSCSGTGNSASGGSGYVLTGAKTVDGITTPSSARPAGYNPEKKYEFSNPIIQAGNESFYGVSGVREIGHEGSGHARITFYGKSVETSANVEAIRINGVIIAGFDPQKYDYTIPLNGEYTATDEITVDKQHAGQIVVGSGKTRFDYHDTSRIVTVFSADGQHVSRYTLNFARQKSSKLFDLKVKNHVFGNDGLGAFNWQQTQYTVRSFQSETVNVEYTTYSQTAKVSVSGLESLKKGLNKISVTVSDDGVEPTVYTIDLVREYALDYPFTATQQIFKVPYNGVYKFETWGAQGGNAASYTGGKGGYSSGEVYLTQGEEVSIFVGGRGDNVAKGWNGAGKSYILDTYGGGASDIRIGGTGFFNRILVAGGGGAAGNHQSGGYAGGLSSQDTGWGIATQTAGFNFGLGKSGGAGCGSAALGGAGSGWYGGYIRDQSCSGTGSGASGGSGYVLTGAKTVDGVKIPSSARPTGYNPDQKYEFSNPVLQAGNESFYGVNGVREIGHEGNGHARITFYGENVENSANLESIRINGVEIANFDPNTYEYTIPLAPEYSATDEISANKQHVAQVVTGLDRLELSHHNLRREVAVISANGKTSKTYVLNFVRSASSKLANLTIDEYTHAFTHQFKYNQLNYELKSYVYGGVDVKYQTYDQNATVKIEGAAAEELLPGWNTIKVTVSSAGVSDTVYQIRAYRQRDMEFAFTGDVQRFKIPYTGVYRFEAWGAQGGNTAKFAGGKGGYSSGEVYLTKGEEVYVYVGGFGDNTSKGWNGAGKSYILDTYGGGASDIRIGGTGYFNRILVAGGGGAAGNDQAGGAGGGLISGTTGAGVATQTAGFNFGLGKSSGPGCGSAALGGAGSGWYGGYVRDQTCSGASNAGGGGSGYVLTASSARPANYAPSVKYYMTQEKLLSGTEAMPGAAGYTTTGHEGNGFVRVSLLNLYGTDASLKSLTIDKGVIDKNFVASIKDYNVTLDSETTRLKISGEVSDRNASLAWDNNQILTINPGTTTYNLPVTAQDGTVAIYKVNVYRPASSSARLDGISIDGKPLANFNPETKAYTLELPYDASRQVEIGASASRPKQVINGLGTLELKNNKAVTISVIAEDQSKTETYTITPKIADTNALKSLTLSDINLNFDPEVTDYEVTIPAAVVSLDVKAQAFDHEATIAISGNGYLKLGDNTIKVVVDEPHVGQRVYTIKVTRSDSGAGSQDTIYDYVYQGKPETFVAPYTGNYQLELWGGEGGHRGSNNGGKGGFATGIVRLTQGEVLTIHVGGAGNDHAKGWNGGAISGTSGVYSGGASDIRVKGTSLNHRLIVAGGGGSVGASNRAGGAGGGLNGSNSSGGYGTGGQGASQTQAGLRGEFGVGGSGTFANGGRGGAGGGGWFGGGGVNPDYSGDDDRAGGGGSGYAFNLETTPIKDYQVPNAFIMSDTQLISGDQSMPSKDTGNTIGNSGNGFVRIIAMRKASQDNHLERIDLSVGKLEPSFSLDVQDYTVNLGVNDTELVVRGVAIDARASVSGNGTYDIASGKKVIALNVAAENGDIKTYTINVNREASNNANPKNIVINGLIPSLCSTSDEYCKLSPQFDPNNHWDSQGGYYTMVVPSRIRSLEFAVIKGHAYQVVTGDGVKALAADEENLIHIDLESEDGTSYRAYTFSITRDMTGNADLERLQLVDPSRDLEFNPDVTEYYVSVPNEYETFSSLNIDAAPMDPNATLSVIKETDDLKLGMNTIIYRVIANNGQTKDYQLNIYREDNANTLLNSLVVMHGDQALPLSPSFKDVLNTYTLSVDNDVSSINVVAQAHAETTTIVGDGIINLEVGVNPISVVTTAQDGTTNAYTISVVRKPSSNARIQSLSISGKPVETFNPDALEQTFAVSDDLIAPVFDIKLDNDFASYEMSGAVRTFKAGNNMVNIRVTAQDGSVRAYVLTITKPIASNTNLKSIQSNMFKLEPFDPAVKEYAITIPYSESALSVEAVAEHPLTQVSGNGNYYLTPGENLVRINAVAENNDTASTVIKVNMLKNNDPSLTGISVKPSATLDPDFDPRITSYRLNVTNDVDMIDLAGVAKVASTTITGNGRYLLNTGSNKFELTTQAQGGRSMTYTLEVIRDASSNTNLDSLYVQEGALHRQFKPDVIEYDVLVPYGTTRLKVETSTQHPLATASILNSTNLKPGLNKVIVRVSSEDKKASKDYTLNVLVQDMASEIIDLASLEVSPGTLQPEFLARVPFYRVSVENSVTAVSVRAKTVGEAVDIAGVGTHNLAVGPNLIRVRTTAKNKVIKDTQIVVTRKPSSDASLRSFRVSGLTSYFEFRPTVFSYYGSTELTKLGIEAVANHERAKVEILGNDAFTTGNKNIVVVRVTAEDGVTTATTTLTVNKIPSKNNNLKTLSISGVHLLPAFSPGNTVYQANVNFDITQVVIDASAEDTYAKTEYKKINALTVGKNYLDVKVISESGGTKTYTVVINREGSANKNIKALYMNDQVFAEFNNEQKNYEINVDYAVDHADFAVELEDSRALVAGVGNHPLKVGKNTITLSATAENGDIRTFEFIINRAPINSAALKDFHVYNYPFEKGFNPEITTYNLTVDHEVKTLNELKLDIVPLDDKATFVVEGDATFAEGHNVVRVRVTSSKGDVTQTYTLNIFRQMYADTYLEYLTVNKGELKPAFFKGILEYRVDLSYDVDSITLDGEASQTGARVSGLQTYALEYGENRLVVSVTSRTGVRRQYHIVVNRNRSNDNYLTGLVVKSKGESLEYSPKFDPKTETYTLKHDVLAGTEVIDLTVSANASNIVGANQRQLKVGRNNLDIVVTSESGLARTYTVVVNRPASSNNALTNITPSSGLLTPNFIYTKDTYDLITDSDANTLSFAVNTEDKNARVSGHERAVLQTGPSIRTLSVTAENGAIKTYTINVVRPQTNESRLKSLAIKGANFAEKFDRDLYTYHLAVPNSKKVLYGSELSFEAVDPKAKVEATGDLVLSTSHENVYEIKVTAVDGYTIQTYRVIVERAAGTDAHLKTLKFETGNLNKTFNPNVTSYDLEFDSSIKTFDPSYIETIEANDPQALIIYDPQGPIDLEVGKTKPFTIIVRSENGASETRYVFNVTYTRSKNNKLQSIDIANSVFKPAFDPEVTDYEVGLLEGTKSVIIRAFVQDGKAKILSALGDKELIGDATKIVVKIQAENGDIRDYNLVIKRNLSNDLGLQDIRLTNAQNASLDPAYSNDIKHYRGVVARETDTIGIVVDKGHESQTINVYDKFNNVLDLSAIKLAIGRNELRLEVVTPFGLKRDVLLTILRAGNDENHLKSLVITDPQVALNFDPEVMEYHLSVGAMFDALKLETETVDPKASVKILGNTLKEGNNDVIVRVSAENGETRDYIIHTLREPRFNNYLSTITVSQDGQVISKGEHFAPKFQRAIMDYTVEVPSSSEVVTVQGAPLIDTTLVTGASPSATANAVTNGVEVRLKPGNNRVELMATEPNGHIATYSVTIFRKMSDDTSLQGLVPFVLRDGVNTDLRFEEGDFTPDTALYTLHVGENDHGVEFKATPNNPNARVEIRGNQGLVRGENRVTITLTSEDRTKTKSYFVKVFKSVSNENNLESLTLIDNEQEHPFDLSSGSDFTYEVASSTDRIALKAQAKDAFAEIEGLGEHALNFGDNPIEVVVKAQSGQRKTYRVVVKRLYDNRMETISTTHGELSPQFDMETTDYAIWVPESVKRLAIHGLALNRPIATVQGGGWVDLALGVNTFPLTVTSPDGSSRVYTVTITRSPSFNNALANLDIAEGILSPHFDKTINNYTSYISEKHKTVRLTITLDDPNASYEIVGFSSTKESDGSVVVSGMQKGDNNIMIRVRAENGDTRDVTLKVVQQDAALFSNRLTSLSVTPNKGMSPNFNPDTNRYIVNVDTSVSEVAIAATKESPQAEIVSGIGNFAVNPGRNSYKVVVRSRDGIDNIYEVIINQAKSGDATLKNLEFKEGNLSPIYTKGRNEYTLNVAKGVNALTPTITPSANGTTWTITGSGIDAPIRDGQNVITIVTRSANDKATQTYTVHVVRSNQASIYLDSLSSNFGIFSETFNKTSPGPYTLRIESNVNSLMLLAKPEDESAVASINGAGFIDMRGINSKTVDVVVTGKTGATMTYTVKIEKALSSNVLLANLVVQPGVLEPMFNPNRASYAVSLDNQFDKVEIQAKALEASAMVSGTGIKNVKVGLNAFNVTVTSLNGDIGVYGVDVTRKAVVSTKALSLRFKEALIENPAFDKDIMEYTLAVPNEVETLNLDHIELEDSEHAHYQLSGNTDLKVGANTVTLTITHDDPSVSARDYTFRVNRQIFSSNFLKDLSTNKGHLTPSFDKYVNNYEITVPYTVNDDQRFALIALPEDSTSSMTGAGEIRDLKVGINEAKVVVTSKENVARTYIVRINRLPNSDNTIKDIEIVGGQLDPSKPFNPSDTGPYVIHVPEGQEGIDIVIALPDGAKSQGDGHVTIKPGDTNHQVVVVSEDGTEKIYDFVIKRPVSSDASIRNIIPSSGSLSPVFDPTLNKYTLVLPDTVSSVGFDVQTTSKQASVSGHELRDLKHGSQDITITVKSEDGKSENVVVISVSRQQDVVAIEVDHLERVMAVGSVETISATINPDNASNKTLIWTSSDPTVAKVDSDGTITALKKGWTLIEVHAQSNPNVKASINVNVLDLTIKSKQLDVVRIKDLENPSEGLSDYVIGSEPETSIEAYKALFENEASSLKVFDRDGQEISDETTLVGTGMTLKLEAFGVVHDNLAIVVRGDVNGDGHVSVLDYVLVNNVYLKINPVLPLELLAMDIDNNGEITVVDIVFVNNYYLKLSDSLNGR